MSCWGLPSKTSFFFHGQLYVVLSRMKSKSSLKVLICDDDNKRLTHNENIEYKEVFNNI